MGLSDKLLLVVVLSEQDAANTKDDCQDTAQKDKVKQHARGSEDIICTDTSGSPPRLVPVLHDIVVGAEVALTIPMWYVVVEASLVARRAGARRVLSTTGILTTGSFVLMGFLRGVF
jgi:hypothetical protein